VKYLSNHLANMGRACLEVFNGSSFDSCKLIAGLGDAKASGSAAGNW